ncbi:MAG: 50S ribosomal protein L23, partial [Chloroflexi bacterium]|nr:50S ribosomal protein L23 [Chloroflexota bacterium]
MHPFSVLREPIITEKSTELAEQGKYVFEVDPRANKLQIREAIEIAFSVQVTKVNVINVRG